MVATGPVIPNFGQGSSCETGDHLFCWDWATEHINRFGTPALQQFELVVISVVIGFAIVLLAAWTESSRTPASLDQTR